MIKKEVGRFFWVRDKNYPKDKSHYIISNNRSEIMFSIFFDIWDNYTEKEKSIIDSHFEQLSIKDTFIPHQTWNKELTDKIINKTVLVNDNGIHY